MAQQKKVKELDVLNDVLKENYRFQRKLIELIDELKTREDKGFSKHRGGVKRAAIDLKKELSKITTATGTYGDYYYA